MLCCPWLPKGCTSWQQCHHSIRCITAKCYGICRVTFNTNYRANLHTTVNLQSTYSLLLLGEGKAQSCTKCNHHQRRASAREYLSRWFIARWGRASGEEAGTRCRWYSEIADARGLLKKWFSSWRILTDSQWWLELKVHLPQVFASCSVVVMVLPHHISLLAFPVAAASIASSWLKALYDNLRNVCSAYEYFWY